MTNPTPLVAPFDVDYPVLRRTDDGSTLLVPEHYEPNYAYPLLVFLTSEATGDGDFAARMSAVSTRNAFGLRIDDCEDGLTADRVAEAVRRVRREYNIHTERIVPVGTERNALAALKLFFTRPDWFAGVACVDGDWSSRLEVAIPFRNPGLRGKPVYLARAAGRETRSLANATRLLHNAGLNVTVDRSTRWQAGLNAWLIAAICRAPEV